MNSSIQTVLGLISPDFLGKTLTHEHLPFGFSKFYIEPPANIREFVDSEITLNNIGFIRHYPSTHSFPPEIRVKEYSFISGARNILRDIEKFRYSCRYNVQFDDEESHAAVLCDMELYKKFGGGAVVENTSHGLQRNVQFMKEVSQKTGVHIISGTGYYLASVQPSSVLAQTQETMYNLMLMELTTRCMEQHDVKCGFIGEVASGWPLHDFEKRAIQAAGEVQAQVGCPVSFHSGRSPEAPFEIIRLFQESGGNAHKAVMSHLERTLYEEEDILEFSSLNTYCQFDLFGNECSYYQVNPASDMPSDAQRIDKILCLLNEGKEENILVGHDIHTKHRLIKFGGHGYSHILNNVLPKMLVKGISQAEIDKIIIKNPKSWLSYKIQ